MIKRKNVHEIAFDLNKENAQERMKNLRSKLMAALSMLLISALLVSTASFAWLIMSIAPEATGITTNIGSNGSLEIALLNTETRKDLSNIKSTFGESLANQKSSANNTWGNIIDLSYSDYGMDDITLYPARLNAVANSDGSGYTVDSGLLSIPTYGFDGRIIELSDDTLSAVYNDKDFATLLGAQDYGVRAIGTSDTLTPQASALAMAKSNIALYTNSAKNAAVAALDKNGDVLFNMMLSHVASPDGSYGDQELDSIKALITGIQSSSDYIQLALRQGVLAYAASEISDEATFEQIRDYITDSSIELSVMMEELEEIGTLPAEYANWITESELLKNNLNQALASCNALSGGVYTWTELKGALDSLMNTDYVYINDVIFPEFDKNSASDLLLNGVELTLAPGSGVLADIADFTDNYSTIVNRVTIKTATTVKPPYLIALAELVKSLEAADGGATATEAVLTTTYGYALDMAFRCNAPLSDLLLQTTPQQRIYDDSYAPSTMGGGSYMEFGSEGRDLKQVTLLMDAVRVAFIDDQGSLLGVAKLNTSNRVATDTGVKAPLYLYEYGFSEEDGSMIMGERKKTDNVITSLDKNIAKALSVVVWLDGDVVDNTMVSAEKDERLSGTLNLQFASSADLVPADNKELMNLATDKTALTAYMETEKETYENGQGTYTSLSWNSYVKAYQYAQNVIFNESASQSQIYAAARKLAEAKAALVVVSHETLAAEIEKLREMMGETDDLARYVVVDKETGYYVAINPYTSEEKDKKLGEIYQVDYTNNLKDEGNGVMTPIYTDESWTALAAALYDAEAVDMDANASDERIDEVLTALDVSYKALQRKVFYIPYDYNGYLYYLAISEETDTYGKWYDSNFKRIVSDKMILDLDAYAEEATIAVMEQNKYVSDDTTSITPNIALLDEIYEVLNKEEIIATYWNVSNLFTEGMNINQIAYLKQLVDEASALTGIDAALIEEAEEMSKNQNKETSDAADALIARLEQAIIDATPEEEVAEDTYMTADQRTLLTKAINVAYAIEGFDNPENTKLNDLRTAVTAAENILANGATKEEAETALSGLNTLLVQAGEKEVTVYNSLEYYIPVSSERYDIVYEAPYTISTLYLSGECGDSTISVVILTKNGVVYTVKEDVTVYSKAGGVQIGEDGSDMTVQAGSTLEDITATLIARVENGKNLPIGETIKTYAWSSSNTSVFTVTGINGSSCTVNGESAGSASLTLTVETEQGNTYTTEIEITVTN